MEETSKTAARYFQIVGFILLFPSLIFWTLWIITFQSNPNASIVEKKEIFFNYLPGFIQSTDVISAISIVTLVLSITFSLLKFKSAPMFSKLLGIISITLGSAMMLLLLFTLL